MHSLHAQWIKLDEMVVIVSKGLVCFLVSGQSEGGAQGHLNNKSELLAVICEDISGASFFNYQVRFALKARPNFPPIQEKNIQGICKNLQVTMMRIWKKSREHASTSKNDSSSNRIMKLRFQGNRGGMFDRNLSSFLVFFWKT